jgi:hypothetical protein
VSVYANNTLIAYNTVHLLADGYGSVAKPARTDSERIIEDMKSYFDRLGVRLYGFIDLKGIAQWAKTMPIVVED